MSLTLLLFRGGGAVTTVVDTSGDLTVTAGRHAPSRVAKRRFHQFGQPIDPGAVGGGLEVHSDGTIRVKIKSGGFVTRDDDGLSVDEAILVQALIAERSLKSVQDQIDDLTAIAWLGLF